MAPAREVSWEQATDALFGQLAGVVLEIGPGRQPRFPSAPGDHWIGVEPHAATVAALRDRVAGRSGRATVIQGVAERIPLPDASVDVAVSSLVLCSVDDAARSLAEVLRVLRPGGRFVFAEHVAAPRGHWLRTAQRLAGLLQRRIPGSCDPARDTGAFLEAAGFDRLAVEARALPGPLGVRIPLLLGTAYR